MFSRYGGSESFSQTAYRVYKVYSPISHRGANSVKAARLKRGHSGHAADEFDGCRGIGEDRMMSVEFETDRAALAGSTGINNTPGGESPTEGALNDPGTNAGQDGTPKRRGRGPGKPKPGVLVLTCAYCHRAITGTGAGFAYVSLVDASKTAARTAAGYHDPAKARWTLAHRGCAPEALAPMSGRYVLWADRIGTTDALLDAMVTLSRERWFAWSDWGALARGILADTETASTKGEILQARLDRLAERRRMQRRETRAREAEQRQQAQDEAKRQRDSERATHKLSAGQRRREQAEAFRSDPTDSRHGTTNGYNNYGCRCDECREANNADKRRQRERIEP